MEGFCLICDRPLGAKPKPSQRFCSSGCRAHFHLGCRKLGEELFESGAVDINIVKMHARRAG